MPRDRVAIVTGAGRGIGRATAQLLAQRGARVLAVARTEGELRSLAEETGVEFLVADLAERVACERVVAEARRRLGPIEILVNNAGVGSAGERQIWDLDTAVWDATMRDEPARAVRADPPGRTGHGRARVRKGRHGQLDSRGVRRGTNVRLLRVEAWSAGPHAGGRPGSRATRSDLQCCLARLGAHRDGGTIGGA